MRNIIRNSLYLCLLVFAFPLYSQDTLSYSVFMDMVKSVHPSAINARLDSAQGDLLVRSSRGNFDPQLKSKYKEKYFQDKFYYRVFDAKLVVPTITGIDIEAGYGNNDGLFLNPENYTPHGGTGYLGVKIPLGKGLFTDENRLQLNLAKQQRTQKEALGRIALNDLLLEASVSYWGWYQAVNIARTQENSILLAKERFKMVKNSYVSGESPAVDTLKAYVQYQERVLNYLSAKQNEVNAHWNLLTYFWDEDLYLKTDLIPESGNSILNDMSQNKQFWDDHPALVYYMSKYKSYDIERKWKVEKLKPKLDFEYKHLYDRIYPSFESLGNSQYWGFNFSFPLFLRKERNDLKVSNLKIEQALNEYKLKERELENKLKAYEAEFSIIQDQIQTQEVTVNTYQKLIEAETVKYTIGESTLFELNSWEQKMIKGQNKLFQLKAKQQLVSAKIAWVLVSW